MKKSSIKITNISQSKQVVLPEDFEIKNLPPPSMDSMRQLDAEINEILNDAIYRQMQQAFQVPTEYLTAGTASTVQSAISATRITEMVRAMEQINKSYGNSFGILSKPYERCYFGNAPVYY